MPDPSRLLLEKQPPLAILTLNEPERRNPLSPTLVRELLSALADLEQDDAIAVVIITGAGTAFCAGADLREMRRASAMEDRAEYNHILALNKLLWSYPKVTIAAVNGFALGAGAGLVNWCDLATADENAEFGFPEVKAGVPSATVVASLSRIVGRKSLFELILTGDRISAADAHRMGLINRVAPQGTVLEDARKLGVRIAGNAAHALAFTKEVVAVTTDMAYDKALAYGRDIRVLSRLHPDFQARIDAHVSKSPRPDGG